MSDGSVDLAVPWVSVFLDDGDWVWDCMCTAYSVFPTQREACREGLRHGVTCAKGADRHEAGW